jgi:hypothetical protein
VGGRRYRPALEDILEALITEKILDGKPGWPRVIDASRENFGRLQLRAAIARNPEIARAALESMGYQVLPPEPPVRGKLLPFPQDQPRRRFRKPKKHS